MTWMATKDLHRSQGVEKKWKQTITNDQNFIKKHAERGGNWINNRRKYFSQFRIPLIEVTFMIYLLFVLSIEI